MILEIGAAALVLSFGASFGLYALGSGATTLTLPRRDALGSVSRGVRDRLIAPLSAAQPSWPEAEASRSPRTRRAVVWSGILWRASRYGDLEPAHVSAIAHCPACEHRLELASGSAGDRPAGASLACISCDLRFPMPDGMTLAEVRNRVHALLQSPVEEAHSNPAE